MGILSSLFGGSQPDYASIVRNVASSGGRGIVQTQYDDFARYIQSHAKVLKATADILHAELKIGGKDHMVVLERERSGRRETGRTIIGIDAKIPINWKDSKIGDILMQPYKSFIKTRSDAENAALAVYFYGRSQFIYDTKAGGDLKQGADSSVAVPVSLKAFANRLPENQGCTMHDWILSLTQNLTREAGETELQVKVIYEIADAIVREYRLLS